MTDDCLDLIGERGKVKATGDHQRYIELRKEVKWMCKYAESVWLSDRARETEDAFRNGDPKKVHKLVKVVAGQKRIDRSIGLKDDNGIILSDREDVKARWYEYCKSLFAQDPEKRDRVEWDESMIEEEPMVTRCEIIYIVHYK